MGTGAYSYCGRRLKIRYWTGRQMDFDISDILFIAVVLSIAIAIIINSGGGGGKRAPVPVL